MHKSKYLLAVVIATMTLLTTRVVIMENTAKLVVESMFSFKDYKDFLKNTRSLESRMSKEAYAQISPDDMNHTLSFHRLTSYQTQAIIDSVSVDCGSSLVIVNYHLMCTNVEPNRSFVLRAYFGANPFKITAVEIGEILGIF